MVNLDIKNKELAEYQNKFIEALQGDDVNAVAKAQVEMMECIQNQILNEAKAFSKIQADEVDTSAALVARGLKPLTAKEKKYYNAVIANGGFEGLEEIMPTTVIDRVFEDLIRERPLLAAIDFVNTSAVTKWVSNKEPAEAAWWGDLCEAIQKQIKGAFSIVDIAQKKLSAFFPVCKAMLDLGPEWLDRYVRAMLTESMAAALEIAIVAGTGKDQPIGILKDLKGAVVEGVYPDKTAVALNDFTPASLGKNVMAPLTKDGKRTVNNVLMVVNPVDYWEKIFPQTTFLSAAGTYVHGVLPIPATIVQSAAMPKGKMAAGVAKDYFMGIGSTQKIEYSDHYQFLEDNRVYIAKQYANGMPKDNESFLVFDISAMTTEVPEIPEG